MHTVKKASINRLIESLPTELCVHGRDFAASFITWAYSEGITSDHRLRNYLIRKDFDEILSRNGGIKNMARHECALNWGMSETQVRNIINIRSSIYK